eukprot:Hpha_TRINITY_DN11562_c0_g2::TRINITY_DN11562_c0_g2_i1::g.32267::m.32267
MPINYDAAYDSAAVIALFGAIAPVWKKPLAESGVDAGKLYKTLEVYQDKAGDAKTTDLDTQALLAMVRAADKSWFSDEQFEQIGKWLDAVAEASANNWQESFGSDDDVAQAIMKALRIEVRGQVQISRDDRGIYVEYKNGDYGGASGKHDGRVVVSDDSVCLFNAKKPGVKIQWQGELPANAGELKAILGKEDWTEVAADDDEDED